MSLLNRFTHSTLRLLIFIGYTTGCSIYLDTDDLQKGNETDRDTDTTPVDSDTTNDCTPTSCNDNIDCTVDTCQANGQCQYLPNNSFCDYLWECKPAQGGCVEMDRECIVDADCVDDFACTIDGCINGICSHVEDDKKCAEHCMENFICDRNLGCTGGTAIECEDAQQLCHDNKCNKNTGECEESLKQGADDDNDGFYDVTVCEEGNDCDDTNPNINPAANEACDNLDNNCDNFIDIAIKATPAAQFSTPVIETPKVAGDSTFTSLIWSVIETSNGAEKNLVYLKVIDPLGAAISSSMNITNEAGDKTQGKSPAIIAKGDGTFLIAWISSSEDETSHSIWLQPVTIDNQTHQVIFGEGTQIASGAGDVFSALSLGWHTSLDQWVAVYGRTNGTNTSVEIITADSIATPVVISTSNGIVQSSSLVFNAADGTHIAVAYAQSDGAANTEIYQAHLSIIENILSLDAESPIGPIPSGETFHISSTSPIISSNGTNTALTFLDNLQWTEDNIVNETTNLWWFNGTDTTRLVEQSPYKQRSQGWAFSGNYYGLLYVNDWDFGESLEFKLFHPDLTHLAEPYLGTRLNIIQGANGTFNDCFLTKTEDNEFFATWLQQENNTTNTDLMFASYSSCSSQ